METVEIIYCADCNSEIRTRASPHKCFKCKGDPNCGRGELCKKCQDLRWESFFKSPNNMNSFFERKS